MMMGHPAFRELPLPPHYDPVKVSQVWRVPYQARAAEARQWAKEHRIRPSAEDAFRIALIAIDVQNTFCLPDFELYVGGRTGTGAMDDNRRLVEFIYRNIGTLTEITATMDTHQVIQIFHSIFLIDERGENPPPMTLVSAEEVAQGRWRFNPAVAKSLGISAEEGQRLLEHYTAELKRRGKYDLTIWPYHAMLGGIGHALVSSVEEAIFFHAIARYSQPTIEIKGANPLTEHYSAIRPEILTDASGKPLGQKSETLFNKVRDFDAVIIAGQAKSHCVAWTIEDLLAEIQAHDPSLSTKVYLLEDCASPVVVPGVVDYTEQAEAAYHRFAEAGMHLVRSTEPIAQWTGITA
jgi:nicotinamidase-related amidase